MSYLDTSGLIDSYSTTSLRGLTYAQARRLTPTITSTPTASDRLPSLRGMTYAEAVASAQPSGAAAGQNYQSFIDSLGNFSMAMSIGGAVTSAIGNYYAIKGQEEQLKAQELSLEFAAQTAELSKNLTEQQVARMGEAQRQQVGLSRMRASEAKASARADAAARGVKISSGSAAETEDTIELMSQIDAMTIEANSLEQISAAERQATGFENEALLSRASAKNIRATAKSLSPAAAFLTTEIGSAGRVAGMFYDRFGVSGRSRRSN